MRNSTQVLSWLIFLNLLVAILLPAISWFVWSFGVPVESLFSAEGIRWFFRQAIDCAFNRHFFSAVFLFSAIGVWQKVLSPTSVHPDRRMAFGVTFIVFLCMLSTLIFAAFHPSSPLLSINGTLLHSPLSQGFVPFVSHSAIVLGLVYGWLTGSVRNLTMLTEVIVFGVCKYAAWLLLLLVASFNYACIDYVLGGI